MAAAKQGPVPFAEADLQGSDNLATSLEHGQQEEEDAYLVSALPSAMDAGGLLKLHLYQGFWLWDTLVPATVALQRRFAPRHDDVIVASFPKCGTTWLNALAFATMARHAYPPASADHPLLRLNPHQCVPFLEGLFESGQESALDALPSPRLMNTHLPLTLLPPATPARCRVVYVCRDPKDMAVSRWQFFRRLHPGLVFASMFESICAGTVAYGPAWDHALGYWRASQASPDTVLFVRYEELLDDPTGNVRELARFLGMPFTAAEEEAGVVDGIVRLCSFGHLKGLEANNTGHLDPRFPVPREALFRKGVAGDWVNHMTPEMASRLDQIVAEKTRGTGLSFH